MKRYGSYSCPKSVDKCHRLDVDLKPMQCSLMDLPRPFFPSQTDLIQDIGLHASPFFVCVLLFLL